MKKKYQQTTHGFLPLENVSKPEADWAKELDKKYMSGKREKASYFGRQSHEDLKQFIAKLLIAQRKKDLEEGYKQGLAAGRITTINAVKNLSDKGIKYLRKSKLSSDK